MTIVACFTLAILMYSMLAFREDTHPLIYAATGLLLAMGIWHIQTLWRSLMLRKHFKKNKRPDPQVLKNGTETNERLLDQPDFENVVPASVTDRTTKTLVRNKT